jgi:hypothetical protein
MKPKGMTMEHRMKAEIKATMRAIRQAERPDNPAARSAAELKRARRAVRNLRNDHLSRMGKLPPIVEDEDELIRAAIAKALAEPPVDEYLRGGCPDPELLSREGVSKGLKAPKHLGVADAPSVKASVDTWAERASSGAPKGTIFEVEA